MAHKTLVFFVLLTSAVFMTRAHAEQSVQSGDLNTGYTASASEQRNCGVSNMQSQGVQQNSDQNDNGVSFKTIACPPPPKAEELIVTFTNVRFNHVSVKLLNSGCITFGANQAAFILYQGDAKALTLTKPGSCSDNISVNWQISDNQTINSNIILNFYDKDNSLWVQSYADYFPYIANCQINSSSFSSCLSPKGQDGKQYAASINGTLEILF